MKHPRNLWPFGIIIAFGAFMLGTAGLVILACSQKVDLVSSDYYEQEIRYQRQMERLDRTQRLNAPLSVAYDAHRQCITISLPPDHARQKPAGRIQLYRPSSAGLDRELSLKLDDRGIHTLDTKGVRPGVWKVRVSWTSGGEDYFMERSVVIGSGVS